MLHNLYILRPERAVSLSGNRRDDCPIVRQILQQDDYSDTDFQIILGSLKFTPLNAATSLTPDVDILTYLTTISHLWCEARHYVMRRGSSAFHHPWLPESDYTHLTLQQVRFGMTFGSHHRFDHVKFFDRTLDNLQQDRGYWGSWMFVQFHYHAIICLLNHPLLLSLRIRGCRSPVCQEFLLTAARRLEVQIEWITRFVEIIEERRFPVSDPSLAHCIAIVATLLQQQMHSSSLEISSAAERNFQVCTNLIDKLAPLWPSVRELVSTEVHRLRFLCTDMYNKATKLRCLTMSCRGTSPFDRSLSDTELRIKESSIVLELLVLSTTCEVSRPISLSRMGVD